jgi:IclR family transcriptional regulator, acetate operon repressor
MSATQLTEKTLDILEVCSRLGVASLPQIQEACGLPMTTAHRIVQTLISRGYVLRAGRGNYRLGSAVLAVAARVSHRDLLSVVARAHLLALSRTLRAHTHLGIWEEGMVTYLVKQRFGKTRLHSAEGMQLEGYCSALGKVLLSGLPEDQCARYLEDGGFVALTPRTLTDPEDLRRELDEVRYRGWGSDNEEIAPGLKCVAVPVTDYDGKIVAAISVSMIGSAGDSPETPDCLPSLLGAARSIARDLYAGD